MGIDFLILGLIYQYPHYAHWIIFLALILAGFNLPISEDLMLLTSGTLASGALQAVGVLPEGSNLPSMHTLWLSVFIGAYLSDWVAYWTGRIVCPKLLQVKWLSKLIHRERIDKMHAFYEKWGFWAFLVGRFIPFGMRNCLFISAGMGKLSFGRFLLIDGIAAFISTTTAFFLAYTLGHTLEQYSRVIWEFIKRYDTFFICLVSVLVLAAVVFFVWWYRKTKKVVS